MFYKHLAQRALVLAALVGFLPMAVSALTMQELTQSGVSPKVLGATTYPVVLVTSSTNTSMKITVQAQRYDGTYWTYQICWNRTKNAAGSLYVSLKSDASRKVFSIDNTAQSGCNYFDALPSTAYRIEFYSMPFGAGILLVRKNLTTRAALTSQTSSGSSITYANGGSPTGGVPASTGKTIYWPADSLPTSPSGISSDPSNPYCKSSNLDICYITPSSLDPVQNYNLSLQHSTTQSSSQWVVGYNYYSSTQNKCFRTQSDGSTITIPCYKDKPLPVFSDSYRMSYAEAANWCDQKNTFANCYCVYTAANDALKGYGHSHKDYCGGYGSNAFPDLTTPGLSVISYTGAISGNPAATTNPTNPSGTTVMPNPTVTNGANGYTYKTLGQILQEKYGITWNPANLPKDPSPLGMANPYSNNYITNYLTDPSKAVGMQLVNANGGKSVQWLGSINYTDGTFNSDGTPKCFNADFRSGSRIISSIPCYADHPLPTITGNNFPDPSNANSSFPWSLANAKCYGTAGINKPMPYESQPISCAGTDVSNFPAPTTVINVNEKVAVSYNGLPMDTNPYDPNNPYAPQTDNNSVQIPGIPVSYGLRMVDANGGKSVQWTARFLYTTGTMTATSGCYKMDRTASETVVVTNIQCYANHPLPVWNKSAFPAFDDSAFDWTMSNGLCYYTAGRDKPEPGASHQIACGPKGANFPAPIYPVDPTLQLASASDSAIVTSITYRQVSGVTSGAIVCYKSTLVTGANASKPTEKTLVTNTTTCPDPLPPVLVVGQIPSAFAQNFDWANAHATCALLDGTPFLCGSSSASAGINGKCGNAAGQIYSLLTSSATGLCSLGNASGFSGGSSGPWSWQCSGSSNGAAASCAAYANTSQQQVGQSDLYSKQSACLSSGGTWIAGSNICASAQSSSGSSNSPVVVAPSSGYSGQKVTLTTPNMGGVGAFLNYSSSNPGVCSAPATAYVNPNDVTSLPFCTCSSKGTTTITITGSGFPTVTQTVVCN